MKGAITAEDLEASFHTETDVSSDSDLTPARPHQAAPAPRLPPGFDRGQPQQPQGDVLGVQSLANLSNLPPISSPLPMFGGGMMPGFRHPFGGLHGHGLALTPAGDPHQHRMRPMWPGPFLPGPMIPPFGQDPNLNPWIHSLMDPRLPPPSSNPLPIPAKSKPSSPDMLLDEGSPITPPNIRNFHFED